VRLEPDSAAHKRLVSLYRRSPATKPDNSVTAHDTSRVPFSPTSCTARPLSPPAGCARSPPQFLVPCFFHHEAGSGRLTWLGTRRAIRACSSPHNVRPWSSLLPYSHSSAIRGSCYLPSVLRSTHGSHNRLPSLMDVDLFHSKTLLVCLALQFLHGFGLLEE
jgi:hypothetical protein